MFSQMPQKSLKLSVLKDQTVRSPLKFRSNLEGIVTFPGQETSLAAKLLHEMQSSNDSLAVAERIVPNVAELSFYLREEQQMLKYEVLPLMTFSTFLSNVGGLVGMWLGLSAISLLELLERKLSELWKLPVKTDVVPQTKM